MKIILDCNIWISFLIGHDAHLIQRILTDIRFDVYICDELLEEIHDVSSRAKIRNRISDEELDDFFRIIYAFCRMARIEQKAQSVICDPKDLYLLSLAESIGADYIVSGDADLLDLKQYQQTKMLRLVEYADRLRPTPARERHSGLFRGQ